jgi:hypothetical protein
MQPRKCVVVDDQSFNVDEVNTKEPYQQWHSEVPRIRRGDRAWRERRERAGTRETRHVPVGQDTIGKPDKNK